MGSYSRAGYTRELRPYDLHQAAREVVELVLPATGRKVRVETRCSRATARSSAFPRR